MRLKEFLTLEPIESVNGEINRELTGLAYDSRRVGPGYAFFAIPGEKADGHDFLQQAAARGAAAVVVSRLVSTPVGTVSVRVRDVRRALALWSARFYGEPSRRLKVVGVTGTNGKTTSTYLMESMMTAAGLTTGVIGTISYRYPGHVAPSHHSTPESLELQMLLADMLESGVRAVAMEVSSHALVQERVRGLHFDGTLFTNLSRDHLDYHADMNEYFAAKAKLFTDHLRESDKPKKSAVIHGADPRGAALIEMSRARGVEIWTFGEDAQWDVHPAQVVSDVEGLRGTIQAKERLIEFSSTLIGAANLQNILGATAAACALGLPDDAMARGINNLKVVPGRLEKVNNRRGVSVLVDYAHTPDALEKVLHALRPVTRGRLFCVFGCGGDRDRGKRPLMGEIAGRLSDIVILTSDNPRSENPEAIVAEVEIGVSRSGKKKISRPPLENGYSVEVDRRQAIRMALCSAAPGDVVLIAGKGHEDYQIIGAEKIHFDDREVCQEELARL